MLIAEVFYSLQGEGELTGVPSVFIRASGCNLRCAWCDTPYASWNPEGTQQTVEQLLCAVEAHPVARHVVITGGEPMIAPGIRDLARELLDVLEPREPDPCTRRCWSFDFDAVRHYAEQYGQCPCVVVAARKAGGGDR